MHTVTDSMCIALIGVVVTRQISSEDCWKHYDITLIGVRGAYARIPTSKHNIVPEDKRCHHVTASIGKSFASIGRIRTLPDPDFRYLAVGTVGHL